MRWSGQTMDGKNSPTTSRKLTHPPKTSKNFLVHPPDAVDRLEVKLTVLHQLDDHGRHVE